MAQLSTTISHAQSATAFHFFTSNRFLPSVPASVPFPDLAPGAFILAGAEGPASGMSTSAIVVVFCRGLDRMEVKGGVWSGLLEMVVEKENKSDYLELINKLCRIRGSKSQGPLVKHKAPTAGLLKLELSVLCYLTDLVYLSLGPRA